MSAESRQAEVKAIESELENWFIARRFRMERATAIHAVMNKHNFAGLTDAAKNTKEGLLWKEIVTGKPQIDSELSGDAKLRKADTYMEIFDGATDNDHPCRAPGMTFFRCLQENAKSNGAGCDQLFSSFEACRAQTKNKQAEILNASLKQQEAGDLRAKSLFEKRAKLLQLPVASK